MSDLNHSRHMDIYAKDIADKAYWQARTQPTARQRAFYNRLYAMCKDFDIDPSTHHEHTRVGFSQAIDRLIARLKEAGYNVQGNGKEAVIVYTHGEDRRRRVYVHEGLMVEGGKPHTSDKRISMHKLF